jgi:hypothetical protein
VDAMGAMGGARGRTCFTAETCREGGAWSWGGGRLGG